MCMTNCLFCNILDGKIPANKVWENEDFFAFLDINPVNPGHVLLIPKKHVDYIFELEEPLYSKIFRASKELSGPIRKAMKAKRIGLALEGFSVPHAHIHLVPINKVNELNPDRAKKTTSEELSRVCKKIIKEIKSSTMLL